VLAPLPGAGLCPPGWPGDCEGGVGQRCGAGSPADCPEVDADPADDADPDVPVDDGCPLEDCCPPDADGPLPDDDGCPLDDEGLPCEPDGDDVLGGCMTGG